MKSFFQFVGRRGDCLEKSYFIVFDGLDGSGKTTQMLMASKYIFDLKRFDPVLLTREPTLRGFGEKMRGILASGEKPEAHAKKCLELYVEDRKEHLKKDILPIMKNKGSVVLCDRYKYSTYAYQLLQGIPKSLIDSIHEKILVPDLVFIADVPPAVCIARMASDPARKGFHKFEKLDFMKKARENYVSMKKLLPEENIVVIDADRPRDEIFRVVRKEIDKLIGIEK